VESNCPLADREVIAANKFIACVLWLSRNVSKHNKCTKIQSAKIREYNSFLVEERE
jgi:hypothetical protein